MTGARINAEGVAVDPEYHYRPMDTCPLGVSVQLLANGGVNVRGSITHQWHQGEFQGWAPFPTKAPA